MSTCRIRRARSSVVRRRSRTDSAETYASSDRSCRPYRSLLPEAASAAAVSARCRGLQGVPFGQRVGERAVADAGGGVRLVDPSDQQRMPIDGVGELVEELAGILGGLLTLLVPGVGHDPGAELLDPPFQLASLGECLCQPHGVES